MAVPAAAGVKEEGGARWVAEQKGGVQFQVKTTEQCER